MFTAIFSLIGAIASVIGMSIGAISAPTGGLVFIIGLCFGLALDGMWRKRTAAK